MKKIILSELGLYYGSIEMPKGFEIDREKLSVDIFTSTIYNKEFPFSKSWDMLQTYLREHINLEYKFTLVHKKTIGNIYKPRQHSHSYLQVDSVDLRHSADYVILYGVNVGKDSCKVFIEYDDNRRKGRSWEIPLNNNDFVMFPSTQRYHITANTSEQLNFILTTTYEYL
jgi:hypothetical protein